MAVRFGGISRDNKIYTVAEINALIEELREEIGGDGGLHYRGEVLTCDDLPVPYEDSSEDSSEQGGDGGGSSGEDGDDSGGGSSGIDDFTPRKIVGPKAGDVYQVLSACGDAPAGTYWLWDGDEWRPFGGSGGGSEPSGPDDVYVKNVDTGLYHKLEARTTEGGVVLALSQTGRVWASSDVYVENPGTNEYHKLVAKTTPGGVVLGLVQEGVPSVEPVDPVEHRGIKIIGLDGNIYRIDVDANGEIFVERN